MVSACELLFCAVSEVCLVRRGCGSGAWCGKVGGEELGVVGAEEWVGGKGV